MKKAEYNNAYNKANYTGVSFRLSNSEEADLIRWIRNQENAKAYICSLVRADMAKQKKADQARKVKDARADQKKSFELMEAFYDSHYTISYSDSYEEALMACMNMNIASCVGPVIVVERGFDQDLNCYYGTIRECFA